MRVASGAALVTGKGGRMAKIDVLTLAILGILETSPLHGYQIRKQLGGELGPFRALSYGSLYPALKRMVGEGLIGADAVEESTRGSRRSKISYRLTDAGKARLHEGLANAGTSSWEDDAFDVRFSLFDRTDSVTRLRILEGRRTRLAQRLEDAGLDLRRVRERQDGYTTELHRHGLETVEREVQWLDRLIDEERSAFGGKPSSASADN
jgi:DNA-binding PadR family transcriptional regulator